ncbi:MAG: hypothetical protein HY482_02620 [Candidatus Wildermuthbacteria bacterium]|nr:hypothetical protein [Candidatus Wildermuthbacteria bacterium]
MATVEDLQHIGLKTAKILEADRVEGSEKLLKLQVSLGEERRQIVAGIGKTHSPESLIGKTIVIASALEPRMLMGIESQGMLLAASKDGEPVLLTTEHEVEPGTAIR